MSREVDEQHVCVLCGISGDGEGEGEDEEMSRFKPSDNFTSWNLLGAGDSLCASCERIFTNQNYRRKSWVRSNGLAEFHKPKEMLPLLINPPEPPFYLYITASGQKQTYLQLFRKGANMNQNAFWIADEDAGLLHVLPPRISELEAFAREAYEKLGQKKWKLIHGAPAHDWKQREICERIAQLRGDPLWQLVVRLV